MSTTAVRSPAEFEEQLQRYLYERAGEGRASRVGEKEWWEQAAIVARYADLFSRDQLRALRDEEALADGDQREWLYRLRKTGESGLIAAGLAGKGGGRARERDSRRARRLQGGEAATSLRAGQSRDHLRLRGARRARRALPA